MGVSIRNTGCLEEAGRGSVYMPDNGLLKDPYCLILTDSEGCNCQSDSYQLYATGECIPLVNNAQSYRFVHVSTVRYDISPFESGWLPGLYARADRCPGNVWCEQLLMMRLDHAGPHTSCTAQVLYKLSRMYISERTCERVERRRR